MSKDTDFFIAKAAEAARERQARLNREMYEESRAKNSPAQRMYGGPTTVTGRPIVGQASPMKPRPKPAQKIQPKKVEKPLDGRGAVSPLGGGGTW
jgi:hypothetical protein